MAKSTLVKMPETDHMVSAPSLRRLLAAHDSDDSHVHAASERMTRLNSLYGKDAPRDHFTATSASPKTSSAAEAQSLEQEPPLTKTSSIESTDSEKAVKGSDDGRVTIQEAMVNAVAQHISKHSDDELNRRGKEAEAIVNGTDCAFSDYLGSHFDKEVSNELGLWPLAASNSEEAKAMVEGLERAYGKEATLAQIDRLANIVNRSDTNRSLTTMNGDPPQMPLIDVWSSGEKSRIR